MLFHYNTFILKQINTIGYVRNSWHKAVPADSKMMKKSISYIEINEEYADGLFKIEEYDKLDVLFYFHKSKGCELKTLNRSGMLKGVFATRSPFRPSLIGICSVTLLEVNGNVLKVTGLDAINGTPVLDIKPEMQTWLNSPG